MYVQAMRYLFQEVLREVQDFAQICVLLHDVIVLDPEYASILRPEKSIFEKVLIVLILLMK